MANLLQQLNRGRAARPRPDSLRRVKVPVPHDPPHTDAVFMVLRRMRIPLVLIVSVFTVMTVGLSLMPGTEEHPERLSVFDAFYVVSYTGLTIGFGEIPHEFSYQQRLWVTLTIYLSVLSWTIGLASLIALAQERTFRQALRLQRFTREVDRIQEPFVLVIGYGQAGESVCRALDDQDRRFVVVEIDPARVEQMTLDDYHVAYSALAASGRDPDILGLAGLGHEMCEAVLALTDDDETNLAVVMAVNLLHPELTVIARVSDRATAQTMHDFAADVVINPFDRYGAYLVMAMQRPSSFRLASWLMSRRSEQLPHRLGHLADGTWVVCADGSFGFEVTRDLTSAGLDVVLVDPADGRPDLSDAVGFIAGAENDIVNIANAAHARLENEDLFVAVRQESTAYAEPLRAFDADSVFVPTELLARETVARITSPLYWSFVDRVLHEEDDWSERVLQDLVATVGKETPVSFRLDLTWTHAPAAVRWMKSRPLRLGDLLRDPEDRERTLAVFPALLIRRGERTYVPTAATRLHEGDTLLMLGRDEDLSILHGTVFHDADVEYVTTGREVATAWIFRQAQNRRERAASIARNRRTHQRVDPPQRPLR